ncbi:MAG: hypothetical protein JWN75_717 [Candidatus Saccharibacteria bacterium]|nr:hypothetical protein [Candidatus Saccharibacteria bacterium]
MLAFINVEKVCMTNIVVKKYEHQERRVEKISEAIVDHMNKLTNDCIWQPTIEMLVVELIEAGVGGSSLRGHTLYDIMSNGTFHLIRIALQRAVAICPRLELHVAPGVAAIIWQYPRYPDKPFVLSAEDEDFLASIQPGMLRHCSVNSYRELVDH